MFHDYNASAPSNPPTLPLLQSLGRRQPSIQTVRAGSGAGRVCGGPFREACPRGGSRRRPRPAQGASQRSEAIWATPLVLTVTFTFSDKPARVAQPGGESPSASGSRALTRLAFPAAPRERFWAKRSPDKRAHEVSSERTPPPGFI